MQGGGFYLRQRQEFDQTRNSEAALFPVPLARAWIQFPIQSNPHIAFGATSVSDLVIIIMNHEQSIFQFLPWWNNGNFFHETEQPRSSKLHLFREVMGWGGCRLRRGRWITSSALFSSCPNSKLKIFFFAGGAVQEEPFLDWQAGCLQVICWDHRIGGPNIKK